MVEVASYPGSPPRKETFTFPEGGSSFGPQYIPRARVGIGIAKIKEFVKGERKIIKMNRTPQAAESDVHRRFDDALDSGVLV